MRLIVVSIFFWGMSCEKKDTYNLKTSLGNKTLTVTGTTLKHYEIRDIDGKEKLQREFYLKISGSNLMYFDPINMDSVRLFTLTNIYRDSLALIPLNLLQFMVYDDYEKYKKENIGSSSYSQEVYKGVVNDMSLISVGAQNLIKIKILCTGQVVQSSSQPTNLHKLEYYWSLDEQLLIGMTEVDYDYTWLKRKVLNYSLFISSFSQMFQE